MNTTAVKSAATTPEYVGEPIMLRKRIGSTTYMVSVRFSETSRETLDDKIFRLIQNDVSYQSKVMPKWLQTGRLPERGSA